MNNTIITIDRGNGLKEIIDLEGKTNEELSVLLDGCNSGCLRGRVRKRNRPAHAAVSYTCFDIHGLLGNFGKCINPGRNHAKPKKKTESKISK